VQDRHYDRHDYLDEKTEALRTWSAYLDELRGARVPGQQAP
jgi:hypothetical protein